MNKIALAAMTLAALLAGSASAQVPRDIAAKLKAIGPRIDPSVGSLYAPLLPSEPYPGVVIVRDLAYGADPLQKLDVFTPSTKAAHLRPVLLFVHGGGFVRGDKHVAGTPFTDNQLVWAVQHGMVGVNIDYRLAPKDPWPAGVKDLAAAIAWTRAHIHAHGGDPDRIFIWGHSAGANHVADYVAHPEIRGGEVAGVKGAILLSPFYAAAVGPQAHAYYGTDADLQTLQPAIGRLAKARIPLFLAGAEYDPEGFQVFRDALKEGLCKAGRCPGYVFLKDHDHLSEGFAVGTADESLTGPMLKWIQGQ